MNTASQQNASNEELKEYLQSLSSSEISQLLQFEIDCCAACRSAYAAIAATTDLITCGKCEFGLWIQFLKLQIPPPTPLHPKCLSTKRASRASLSIESCMSQDIVKRRRNRARFENPRLFQLMQKNQNEMKSKRQQRNHREVKGANKAEWDVFARSFLDPWGQSLGIGSTEEQNFADEVLLRSTRLWSDGNGSIRCFLSFDDIEGCHSKKKSATASSSGMSAYRIFRLASRGKFLCGQEKIQANKSQIGCKLPHSENFPTSILELLDDHRFDNYPKELCCPWFFPDEWFSFPLFLSNRFEMALRDTLKRPTFELQQHASSPLEKSIVNSHVEHLKVALNKVTAAVVKCSLYSNIDVASIRDLPIRKLIQGQICSSRCVSSNNIIKFVMSIPLCELGSEQDNFRKLVQRGLEEELSKIYEANFLSTLEKNPNSGMRVSTSAKISSKKKKQKRKKKKTGKKAIVKETPTARPKDGHDNIHDGDDDDCSVAPTPMYHVSNLPVPKNIPTKERNRATMISLTIIEDIFENVFDEAGLNEKESPVKQENNEPALFGDKEEELECPYLDWTTEDFFAQNQETVRRSNSRVSIDEAIESSQADFRTVGLSLNFSGAFDGLLADLFEDKKEIRASSTAASIASSVLSSNDGTPIPTKPTRDELETESKTSSIESVDNLDYLPNGPSNCAASLPTLALASNIDSSTGTDQNGTEIPSYVTLADIGELRRCSLEASPGTTTESLYKSHAMSLSQENLSLLLRNGSKGSPENGVSRLGGALLSSNKSNSDKHHAFRSEGRKRVKSSDGGLPHCEHRVKTHTKKEERSSLANACAQSLSGLPDAVHDISSVTVREDAIIHDESATIRTSPHIPSHEEGMVDVREERDAYRDMCLTLGAEVSKLRNMLAATISTHSNSATFGNGVNDTAERYPDFPSFDGIKHGGARTIAGPMSVAGFSETGLVSNRGEQDSNHGGDNSSCGLQWMSQSSVCSGRRIVSECDKSITGVQDPTCLFDSGFQSRLSADIYRFMEATSAKLKANEKTRKTAITRIWKLVTALWPRAQVKVYGSHTCDLSLPSSDIDFVICLPAVHKNAPAVAPGVLEGRNAINETWQKVLARKLKGESWLEPRSIKIIDRTAVPVIKVSTKDRRDKVLQLDISFASPEHHGLQAIHMVIGIMEEMPMVRPLVLVLKQFLQDRGLLTAYTGGLSSYSLFLMVTRYLQEQPNLAWSDCGSLLMGFLDFYGNCFDPRSVGISVKKRKYFSRHVNHIALAQQSSSSWAQQQSNQRLVPHDNALERRHSFNEKRDHMFNDSFMGSINSHGSFSKQGQKLHHQQSPGTTPSISHVRKNKVPQQEQPAAKPYTFDPLFVEDPLKESNNIGRNAFRVFQVKRAFADAHRALVATLEWDMHDTPEDEKCQYPLLKCLLQNEDIVLY